MSKTQDLGRRVELQPMDKHCEDISIALYQRDVGQVPQFLLHTYSSAEGARERLVFLRQTLIVMLGMEPVADDSDWLRFPCKTLHERAMKRAFLDLCKLKSDSPLVPKPLTVFDKKADMNLTANNVGNGAYEMVPEQSSGNGPKRAAALARGFAKLCDMQNVAGEENQVAFDCKNSHDALIGTLMYRAQNVRAAMQEEEMTTSRGVLSSPSQQQ